MAGRADAATDRCSRSTAPSLATYSMCAWVRQTATHAGNLFHPILRLSDAGDSSAWIVGMKGTSGRTPSVYSPSNSSGISGAEQTLNTWVFVGATLSGTTAQLFYGTTPGSLTKVTGTVAASNTPTQFGVFGRSAADGSEWLEGDMYGLRQWSGGTILSDAEMAAESQLAPSVSTPAARTTNLWHSIPFTAAALTDVASGGARPLTAGSTALSSVTDPPLSTTIVGTGTATVSPAAASGAGGSVVAGAGAAAATPGAGAGSGGATASGSGAAVASPATAMGAGGSPIAGSGAAAASPPSGSGAGGAAVAGSGGGGVLPATSAGTGGVEVAGSGVAAAPAAVGAGLGGSIEAIGGDGAAIAPSVIAAGSGGVIVSGSATAVAAPAHSAGSPAAPGSLRLQVGESQELRWLDAGTSSVVDVVETGASGSVFWLGSGEGSPA